MLYLARTNKGDYDVQMYMRNHYSRPMGFVGRQIIYKVMYNDTVFGAIAGSSATLHLPNRISFLAENGFENVPLTNIVNNSFFHVEGPYPERNFVKKTLKLFRKRISFDWVVTYHSAVIMFETLVEPPRLGTCYLRDTWTNGGMTRGKTCKRIGNLGSKWKETYSGQRVWDTSGELKPKHVFYRMNKEYGYLSSFTRLTSRKDFKQS